MMWLKLAPWALGAIAAAAAGFLWWQLGAAQERIGALDQANKQLTSALKEKQDALQSRARTDDDVRRLNPDDILNRLR